MRDETVQVGVGWALDVEAATADVIRRRAHRWHRDFRGATSKCELVRGMREGSREGNERGRPRGCHLKRRHLL